LARSQPSSDMVVGIFKQKIEANFKDERDDGQIRGI
jgi:hypothetical protein